MVQYSTTVATRRKLSANAAAAHSIASFQEFSDEGNYN